MMLEQTSSAKLLGKSGGIARVRVVIFGVAVISYSLHSILTEGAKSSTGSLSFDVAAVVAMSELVKLAVTILFLLHEGGMGVALRGLCNMREQVKAAIPALLWTQEDPGTMQLLSNFKIIPTVFLSVLFLRKNISMVQYKALGLLLFGTIALHSVDDTLKVGSTYLGLLQASIYCVVSGVAGVWCEKVLREGSLHVQNMHLYIWGCIMNTIWLVLHLKPDSISGLWGVWPIANISNQALTGLLISVLLKYAGNVDKLFVVAASVIPAGVTAYFVFGYEMTVQWLCSAGIIVAAICIYITEMNIVILVASYHRIFLLLGFGLCAIIGSSQIHLEFLDLSWNQIFGTTNTKNSAVLAFPLPHVILSPSQPPNNTLGFLQALCNHDDYPLTPSCFHSPTDLWPDTPEFATYKNCSLLHWQDFLNDEFNGVSWCPDSTSFGTPCRWHHHVSLSSFAQCMLNKWNITYFLDTGGLVGTLRNGGFELTDHDLDFAAWVPDTKTIDRLKEMQKEAASMVKASENVPQNVTITIVVNGRIHVNFLSSASGQSLGHVDVWRFNVTEGNHSNVRPPAWPGGTGIDKENLFPLGQCNFMGKVVPCPHRPHPFLKQWYHLVKSDLSISPGTGMYTPEASLASSNRSMHCLEAGGFPSLRKGTSANKPFFAADDPRGIPFLSD